MSDSLWPPGLYSPWNSPGQNTGVGKPFPSPGDLHDPGIERRPSGIAGEFFTIWATRDGKQFSYCYSVQFSHSIVSESLRPHELQPRQAFLSITSSQNLPKLMSTESVMPSNHLILCHPFLLLPSLFPNIRVFSNESAPRIRWRKYWSYKANIHYYQ